MLINLNTIHLIRQNSTIMRNKFTDTDIIHLSSP